MDNVPVRSSGFVAGGLFIGIWMFLGLFPTSLFESSSINYGYWWFWGLVGLAISGGLFASRIVSQNARIGIWITLGIGVGMLIGAAVFQHIGESVAALFTAGGGAIIVASLPSMAWTHVPPQAPYDPYAAEAPPETPPTPPRPRRSS